MDVPRTRFVVCIPRVFILDVSSRRFVCMCAHLSTANLVHKQWCVRWAHSLFHALTEIIIQLNECAVWIRSVVVASALRPNIEIHFQYTFGYQNVNENQEKRLWSDVSQPKPWSPGNEMCTLLFFAAVTHGHRTLEFDFIFMHKYVECRLKIAWLPVRSNIVWKHAAHRQSTIKGDLHFNNSFVRRKKKWLWTGQLELDRKGEPL